VIPGEVRWGDIPVYFFTPNLFPAESLPFFEDPPPLFVAVRICRWAIYQLLFFMFHPSSNVLEGPANNSDFNSDEIPCKALERVNRDVPNIIEYSVYD